MRIVEVYEVVNPSLSDLNLEQQIEYGVCDWIARLNDGREIVGETREKATANAQIFCQ